MLQTGSELKRMNEIAALCIVLIIFQLGFVFFACLQQQLTITILLAINKSATAELY